jgi:hypothetical protein
MLTNVLADAFTASLHVVLVGMMVIAVTTAVITLALMRGDSQAESIEAENIR